MYRKRVTYRCKRYVTTTVLFSFFLFFFLVNGTRILRLGTIIRRFIRDGLGIPGVSIEPDETIYYLLKLASDSIYFLRPLRVTRPSRCRRSNRNFFFPCHKLKIPFFFANKKISEYVYIYIYICSCGIVSNNVP